VKRVIIIYFLILGCISFADAQQQDTVAQSTTTEVTEKPSKNTFFTVFRGNPGKAALYSLIIPGSGQLYNGQWWKVPFVYGIEGGLFVYAYWNTSKYKDFKTGYQQMLDGEIVSFKGLTQASQVRLFRDKYQRQKDFAWVYFAISHLLNVVDAFVSRHLREFDMDEDLSFKIFVPEQNTIGNPAYVGFGISYTLDKKK
jgi:TM2 domain-containing membrane protein YozV